MSGTALIVLDESNGRREVVVLAASREGLENTVARLLELIPLDAETALGNCLVQDPIALCPTLIADEEVEAELITSGGAEIDEPDEDIEDDILDDDIEPGPDIDATDMGSISLGETVTDIDIAENESHAWTFSEGPVFLDIVLETSEDMDGVLEIYDPNNLFLVSSDDGLTGEPETLTGIEIPDDGAYTIVVRGFFGASGTYSLSVTEGDGAGGDREGGNQSIFLFIDDDGEPIADGITSADTFMALLQPNYDVTQWVSSIDGPLSEDTVEDYGLIIWDSGDYVNYDGFFDEDTGIIISYLDNGGNILVTGSAPSVFGELPLSELTDISATGDDPILLENLASGDTYELDQTFQAGVADTFIDDIDPTTTTFFLRGSESEDENTITAFAVRDEDLNQQTVFIMLPFAGLPDDLESILMENILNWFAFNVSHGS